MLEARQPRLKDNLGHSTVSDKGATKVGIIPITLIEHQRN